MKWEDVTRDKEEGGLGIKDLGLLNDVMVLNQLWSLEGWGTARRSVLGALSLEKTR